jgi:hypothetical protein
VRDHVKSIFEKLRVSSRAQLLATLFSDHDAMAPLDAIAA